MSDSRILDYDNMGRALTIMKEFLEKYPIYSKISEGDVIKFSVYKKKFFGGRTLVAYMSITILRDFLHINLSPKFDNKFLLVKTVINGVEIENFISNHKYLKIFGDELFERMKEAGRGQPLYTAVKYLAEAATFQKMAKELDYFDTIEIN